MKIVSIILGVLLSGCAPKNIEVEHTLNELVFTPFLRIQIAPTFEKPIEYELTPHEPYLLLYSEYEGKGGYNWGKKGKTKRINLSEDQHIKVIELLEGCLTSLPQNDRTIGPDGDIWILETTVFQYLKTMIWEPEEQAELRGYSSLIELRNYLNKLVIEGSK